MYSSLIIPSPLGDLIAVASESHLIMLEFADSKALERKMMKFDPISQNNTENPILLQTQKELSEYFT